MNESYLCYYISFCLRTPQVCRKAFSLNVEGASCLRKGILNTEEWGRSIDATRLKWGSNFERRADTEWIGIRQGRAGQHEGRKALEHIYRQQAFGIWMVKEGYVLNQDMTSSVANFIDWSSSPGVM